MKIGHKLIAGFVGIALLVVVVGAIAVQQQFSMASVAAITEATHVAETAAYAITLQDPDYDTIALYRDIDNLKNYVTQLHDLQKRDVVVVDTHKKILADAIDEDVGTVFEHDAENQVAQTIADQLPRTFIDTSDDHPVVIRQIVVPLKDQTGTIQGAVVFEYTKIYNEMVGLAQRTSLIVSIASIVCVLLAILLGYLIARSISRPINQLQEAMIDITNGNLERMVPIEGSGELKTLAQAFNQMTQQLAKAQQQLQQWNQTLEQTVVDRTTELSQSVAEANDARAVAEQANLMKSQFLANMSHELRTPLNSIINFTRIVLSGARGPVTEGQVNYLNRVRHSGEHLLGLINDILDLSKIEAGRMELYKETLDIGDLVQSVLTTAAGLTKEKPITLQHEIDPNVSLIEADRTRVRQILLNLLSNAAKFTDKGSITVRVASADTHIVLRVIDTGIGIAPEYLAAIFEEFQQVDSDSNRVYGGTGLGLAICRSFVELHGGQIWAESTPGVGSTFSFTLPSMSTDVQPKNEHPAMTSGTEQEDTRITNGLNILVIDDDQSAIEIVATYLQRDGYHVSGITDSRHAVAQVRMLRPAAIILDVLMPYKDGWEILAEIKSDPELAQVPVILYTITEQQALGYHLGASAYLVKPINEQQLRATLEQLVAPQSTVMVIDDDPNALEIVSHHLAQSGQYRVVTALDGLTGLRRIAEIKPNLIILDLMMPEMDGFAVLEELKNNPLTLTIPVVVLTAKELTAQERQQLNQRVSGLMAKVLTTPEHLLNNISNVLATLSYNPTRISDYKEPH